MAKMKYVYGPVPSRRLGQSLGIDPIPLKTCNWNCVYCQLGRTVPLTNERRPFIPREDILDQVKHSVDSHQNGEINWITVVGSGEPTLYADIGCLIRKVKSYTQIPVAVITNGSLLYLPEVRQALLMADAVLPSLDAGEAWLYRKINRPHPEITFNRLVDGLIAFRGKYSGKLWVEVMLVQGLNDTEDALKDIALTLQKIRPDEVHINIPSRPPVETWVQAPDEEGLLRAQAILGSIAKIVHPISGTFDLRGSDSLVDAVVGIITRHPMREDEMLDTLTYWSPDSVKTILTELENSGKARVIERYGVRFWGAATSNFPDKEKSQVTSPGQWKHKIGDE